MRTLRLSLSALALAAAAAGPALSDTLAADIWSKWQLQAQIAGQVITADETENDTGLTLSNVTMLSDQDGVRTLGEIETVQLTENPDGTLSITFSDLYRVTFTFPLDPGEPEANIELEVRFENLDVRVSGDPGSRLHTYTADAATVTEGRVWGGERHTARDRPRHGDFRFGRHLPGLWHGP